MNTETKVKTKKNRRMNTGEKKQTNIGKQKGKVQQGKDC